jgi:hypothetical protein
MNRRSFLRRLAAVGAAMGLAPALIERVGWRAVPVSAVQDDEQIRDIINATLRDLGEVKWTDVSSSLQSRVAMKKLLTTKRIKFDQG